MKPHNTFGFVGAVALALLASLAAAQPPRRERPLETARGSLDTPRPTDEGAAEKVRSDFEGAPDDSKELKQLYSRLIEAAGRRGFSALVEQLQSHDRRLRIEAARQLIDQLAGGRPEPVTRLRSSRPGGAGGATGGGRGPAGRENDERYAKLPDISTFATTKSDRFIVDMDHVTGGHPFKGLNANRPHSGAHVYLGNPTNSWPEGGTAPANYPPIYAAADGVVTNVTETFRLTTGADRYGLAIAFARDAAGSAYRLHYAIEPFVHEPSRGFYKPFILVSQGQEVKKGDVIATMYTPPGQINTHICFRIQPINGGHMAPAIFTQKVVEAFQAKWKEARFRNDGEDPMPPCMGYKLTADENPFGTGPAKAL